MTRRHPRLALFVGILLLTCLRLPPLGAAESPRVYRDRIEPHWSTNHTRFWYRNDLRQGTREFVEVNVAAGTRQLAFDHSLVASNLARLTGTDVAPDKLPVESLEFTDDVQVWILRGATNGWRLNRQTGEVTVDPQAREESPALEPDAEPHPSQRTGPETEIRFVNRLDIEVQLFWIDEEGRRQPYGTLAAGAERAQHTFAGHAWLATARGNPLGTYTATPKRSTAYLGQTAPSQTRRSRRNPARPAEPQTVPSPDGKLEAFVRDHNLWIRNIQSRGEKPVSLDGNPGNSYHHDVSRDRLVGMEYEKPDLPTTLPEVYWSPDSTRLVALQTRSVPERRVNLVESSPRDQLQPRLLSYPYLKAGDEIPTQTPHLFRVSPADDASAKPVEIPLNNQLFANPWSLSDFRWASNSARFSFVYNQRGHQVLRVLDVDAAAGEARAVVDEQSATFIDYSGKFLCDWLSDDELLWMSERDGWNHLYLYDVGTRQVKRQITRGHWAVHDLVRVDREHRLVWFRAVGIRPEQDPYHLHLTRASLDDATVDILTEGDGTHSIEWSPDQKHFLDTWSRVDQPPVLELRRSDDGRRVCQLETADATDVTTARGRLPERFVAKGRDGTTDIHGIIHRPRDFDPARRYPVVENIYAGPHDFHVPKAFRAQYRHQEQLADLGFIVVQIDGMGTSWRSKAFHDVAWKNLKDAGFPDRIAWMKAAATRHPELDLTRVGIYGGSAGGQNAAAALVWHGDFYKAAVADCGCHDNRMDKIWWNEQWMGWPVGPHYAENSNTVNADRLQGKLLLVVGELDKNVDPSSTYQFAAALQRANKDHELLVVAGAGHGAAETPFGSKRRADFFVKHLLSAPK